MNEQPPTLYLMTQIFLPALLMVSTSLYIKQLKTPVNLLNVFYICVSEQLSLLLAQFHIMSVTGWLN